MRRPVTADPEALDAFVGRILEGDERAAGRAMRLVDDRQPVAVEILKRLYPHTGRARIVGITGNPGSGKSTLTDRIIRYYRDQDLRVGVVAVDPSSPFSGGAILGDRIRMSDHATDRGVFIRSLATRGHLGGLSRSTADVVSILDAMGFDVVLLETVGVGQDEVEVVKLAHTSVVVLVPGLGDDIQAIKAGILEIADVFAINKADREGVDRTIRDIRALQSLAEDEGDWRPPIVPTVAVRGEGIPDLLKAVHDHQDRPSDDAAKVARLRDRAAHVLETIVRDHLVERMAEALGPREDQHALLDRLIARDTDPYTEANRVLAEILRGEA
ncbi:MAG: methylmalonyl Co-A mutase-associated GTPase MeaB [Myxococcota bacterium]